jgi:6-phosphogluconolactonase (cycloisomerase 2 family)
MLLPGDRPGSELGGEVVMSQARIFAVAVLVALHAASSAADAQQGALTQLPGVAACVSEDGNGGQCADAKAMLGGRHVAMSADGKSVYTASVKYVGFFGDSGFVGAFSRDPHSGELTQLPGELGCMSDEAGDPTVDCMPADMLAVPQDIAIPRDGRHVYVAVDAPSPAGILTFARNRKTGELRQPRGARACAVGQVGSAGANAAQYGCREARALRDVVDLEASPDGRHLYAAAGRGVVAFARDAKSGLLTQLPGKAGCVTNDGSAGTVGSAGSCAQGRGLSHPRRLAMTRTGKFLYVLDETDSTLTAFRRNKRTGELTQLPGQDGCWSQTGNGGVCRIARGFHGPTSLALSPNAKHLYVAALHSSAVAIFSADKTTGALAQLTGRKGCISEDGSGGACTNGKMLASASSVAVAPDGKTVYVQASEAVNAYARNPDTGALARLRGRAGCVSAEGSGGTCAEAVALYGPRAIVPSPDGAHVYVEAPGSKSVAAFSRATAP